MVKTPKPRFCRRARSCREDSSKWDGATDHFNIAPIRGSINVLYVDAFGMMLSTLQELSVGCGDLGQESVERCEHWPPRHELKVAYLDWTYIHCVGGWRGTCDEPGRGTVRGWLAVELVRLSRRADNGFRAGKQGRRGALLTESALAGIVVLDVEDGRGAVVAVAVAAVAVAVAVEHDDGCGRPKGSEAVG